MTGKIGEGRSICPSEVKDKIDDLIYTQKFKIVWWIVSGSPPKLEVQFEKVETS